MQSPIIQDHVTSAVLQDAAIENIQDPLAQAAGISPTAQNMASAKKKLEMQVKDLTISVDNQNQLLKTAQEELSEIDQKIGAIQSRISMAKVSTTEFPKEKLGITIVL